MEEQRARDVHEARDKILRGNTQHLESMAEVDNLRSALADVVKEARNQSVSLCTTVWSQSPPNGLREFIDQ
eukprot:5453113-Amphidinium_carterae.1